MAWINIASWLWAINLKRKGSYYSIDVGSL